MTPTNATQLSHTHLSPEEQSQWQADEHFHVDTRQENRGTVLGGCHLGGGGKAGVHIVGAH